MKNNLIKICKYIAIILLITIIQLGLLVGVAVIPKKSIKDNMKSSAEYLASKPVFFMVDKEDKSSVIDRYADSIILGIAWGYDDEHPITAVMKSSYYHLDTANENENLLAAVTSNLLPNYDYTRYWHGSLSIVRSFLVWGDIKVFYINLFILLLILCICQALFLGKIFNWKISAIFIIGLISISPWYIPQSMEYAWTFLIMFIASISSMIMCCKGKKDFSTFFLIVGSFTAFFDFLTTETITLLIPVLIILLFREKRQEIPSFKDGFFYLVRSGIMWLLGYASCFIAKWSIASIVLQKNCFKEALSQAGYRISGETANIPFIESIFTSINSNLACIFPFSFTENGHLFVFICMIVILSIYYLFKKEKEPCYFSNLMFVIGTIPLLRFMILNNHSTLHYFFTYRVLMVSVICIGLALLYGIDSNKLQKHKK
ncbi:MAG: hypothetical protein E7258_03605 [Lachnospiraceae bacterium]|nr:hypothetical protein [Lachnospiraceae bacterium]